MDWQNQCGDIHDEGFHQRAELEVELADVSSALLAPSAVFWNWNAESDILYTNKDGRVLTPETAQLGMTLSRFCEQIVHPGDRGLVRQVLDSVLLPGGSETRFSFFYRAVQPAGGYRWYLVKGFVVERDEAGHGTRMMGVVLDEETLRELRERHAEHAERTRFALEAARDGLWDWNTQTNDTYFSPRYLAMLGYEPEEFPPRLTSWADRVHAEDLEATIRTNYLHINTPYHGDMFECVYRFLAADGTYRWILSRGKVVQRDKDGRGRRVVGLHTDITELRTIQESLRDIVNYDHLTKLSSRFAFDAKFDSLEPSHLPVSLIYMDVDGLKLINDSLGHEAGDGLLTRAADIIRGAFRTDDLVARIGGDEFVALLPHCPSRVARRLMDTIESTCYRHNEVPGNLPIFLSLGMASSDEGIELFRLQSTADNRMMAAKRAKADERFPVVTQWLEEHADRRVTISRGHRR